MANDKKNEVLEKLALKLRMYGPLTGRELQKFMGVSQPQLSRYLKLLGSQLLKIGLGKSIRYAHTREISNIGHQISIFSVDKSGKLEEDGTLYPIFPKGFYWLCKYSNESRIFDDLPYFLNDLSPSGFLGRLIPRTYPDWRFPEDIRLWNAESTLRYLCNFGVDLVGNQIVGEISAQKFLQTTLQVKTKSNEVDEIKLYEELARDVEVHGVPGSSAGGEHPKFLTLRPQNGTPVIVKFVLKKENEITHRRIDLLRAEQIATNMLSTVDLVATARIIEGSEYTFLEIVRFDRCGHFGREGVISLFSLDAEFAGSGESWGVVAQKLSKLKILDNSILNKILFREYFGHFIGNTDMHSGNLSFFFEKEKVIGLTPIYDMLPMKYAPAQERISTETVTPIAPRPGSIGIWEEAKNLAICFWQEIQVTKGFTSAFVDIAQRNEDSLKLLK